MDGPRPTNYEFDNMPSAESNMAGFEDHTSEITNLHDLGLDYIFGTEFDITDWTTLDCELPSEVPALPMQLDFPHNERSGLLKTAKTAAQPGFASAERAAPNLANLCSESASGRLNNIMISVDSNATISTNKYSTLLPAQAETEPSADLQSQRRTDSARPQEQWPTDWDPGKSDNAVSFPDLHGTPLGIFEAENFAHVPEVDQHIYDAFLHCVAAMSDEQQVFRPFLDSVPPSLEAFNCFVQLYFEYFQPIFPMLHQPTFDPSTSSWVLVLALAAIGSRYSKIRDSSRCSNALQELLRRAIQISVSFLLKNSFIDVC
jgi:hypothetical protein